MESWRAVVHGFCAGTTSRLDRVYKIHLHRVNLKKQASHKLIQGVQNKLDKAESESDRLTTEVEALYEQRGTGKLC